MPFVAAGDAAAILTSDTYMQGPGVCVCVCVCVCVYSLPP